MYIIIIVLTITLLFIIYYGVQKEKAKKINKQNQWQNAIRFWIKEMNIEE